MRQLTDRRLVVTVGCWLLLAGGPSPARGEDFFGYCEVVSGPKSTADVDAPPAYVASRSMAARPRVTVPPAVRPAAAPVVYAWSSAEPPVSSQARQAISYYGGASALATLSQMPRRPSAVSNTAPASQQAAKPFQTIYRDPTVSPYLNLYSEESNSEAAPSYFAFVRPQLDQIETNRRQMRELQQLQRQMQSGSPAVVGPQYRSAGPSTTGRVAHFMDTAQFYGQWR